MQFDFKKKDGSEMWLFKIDDGLYEISLDLLKDDMTALSTFLKLEGF